MLFGVTDTSVLIAVVVYATIPATRYTIEGLRSVPTALHDAGSMSGVTRLQRWLNIELERNVYIYILIHTYTHI